MCSNNEPIIIVTVPVNLFSTTLTQKLLFFLDKNSVYHLYSNYFILNVYNWQIMSRYKCQLKLNWSTLMCIKYKIKKERDNNAPRSVINKTEKNKTNVTIVLFSLPHRKHKKHPAASRLTNFFLLPISVQFIVTHCEPELSRPNHNIAVPLKVNERS